MKGICKSHNKKPLHSISIRCLIFLCLFLNTTLQATNIDSLKTVFNSNQHDTIRISAAEGLIWFYNKANLDSAIIYAQEMLSLSRKNNLKKREIKALSGIAAAYMQHGEIDIDSAMEVYQEALVLSEKINDLVQKASILNGIAIAYVRKGEYDIAIEHSIEARDISKKLKHDFNILQSTNIIGTIFSYQGNYQKALTYLKQGLTLALKINNDHFITQFTHNVAVNYNNLENYDSSLHYYEKSLVLSRKKKMDTFASMTLDDIGRIHFKKGRIEIAQKSFLESYDLARRANYAHGLSKSLYSLAEISHHQKRYNQAIDYLKESYVYIKTQNDKLKHYRLLKECYIGLGDYKSALEAMESFSIVQDSLFNLESQKQVEELNTKYEVTQKENENKFLKAKSESDAKIIKNQTLAAIGLILALLLAAGWGFYIYRANQRKKEINQILEQKVDERTQELKQANYELRTFNYIASHDIKEPIRNIGSYVSLISRKLPPELKLNLGDYFQTIKNSTTQLYTLIEDFANYTKLSKDDKIETQNVDLNWLIGSIENGLHETIQRYKGKVINHGLPTLKTSSSLLYTSLKNLIENGLKFNQSPNPTVEISYNKTETHHEIIVSDNGIGIDEQFHDKIFEMFKRLHNREAYQGSGIGLAIVKLCMDKLGGQVEMTSEINKGSVFKLQLPTV